MHQNHQRRDLRELRVANLLQVDADQFPGTRICLNAIGISFVLSKKVDAGGQQREGDNPLPQLSTPNQWNWRSLTVNLIDFLIENFKPVS